MMGLGFGVLLKLPDWLGTGSVSGGLGKICSGELNIFSHRLPCHLWGWQGIVQYGDCMKARKGSKSNRMIQRYPTALA